MCTTFSVVESIPPLTSRRRRPVSFSPPVVKLYQVPLTRSSQFTFTFTHAQSSSREAIHVHAQFTAHEEHPSSRPTPQPSVPTVPRILFSSYLRRPLGYSHRPSQHKPRESFIRFSDQHVFLQCSPFFQAVSSRKCKTTWITSIIHYL